MDEEMDIESAESFQHRGQMTKEKEKKESTEHPPYAQ
jgi:hypothetical protein